MYISMEETNLQHLCAADGEPGIVYTTDWAGNPVVHDRMHWTLDETVLDHVKGLES